MQLAFFPRNAGVDPSRLSGYENFEGYFSSLVAFSLDYNRNT